MSSVAYALAGSVVTVAFGYGIFGERILPPKMEMVLEKFRERELVTNVVGTISVPFFQPQGTMVRAGTEGIQIYEYDTRAALEADLRTITAYARRAGNLALVWKSEPYFYRSGNRIILYVGADETIRATLAELFGPPVIPQVLNE